MTALVSENTTPKTDSSIVKKLDVLDYPNSRFIAGYANIHGIVDNQNELVTRTALEGAWSNFVKSPEFALCQLMHSNIPIAKIILEEVTDSKGNTHKSGVNSKGLYIVAQVRDDITIADEVWKNIQTGKVRGFSIGGRNLAPGETECNDSQCYTVLRNLELYEVSLVDRPANRVSIFNILKCDEEVSDILLKLSEATKTFTESTLIEGIIQVSKTPDIDGRYDLLACNETGGELCKALAEYLSVQENLSDFNIVKQRRDDTEYVKLFDLSLSRPYKVMMAEGENGGSNSLPLEYKPKSEGETPMDETIKEEKIEEKEESQIDSETPESQEVNEVEEKSLEEPEIAPLTLESLAADLAKLTQLFTAFTSKLSKMDDEEEPIVEAVEKSEKPEVVVEDAVSEEPAEAIKPEIVEEIVVPEVVESPTPEPVVPEPIVEEVAETPIKEEEPEFRGVTPPIIEERKKGFDVLSMSKVTMAEIHNLESKMKLRR